MKKTEVEIPKSYAGFLTVNATLDNHLFFWFFPSQERKDAPLLIWLSGGPGISSLVGAFGENGPLQPRTPPPGTDAKDVAGKFEARSGSWLGPFSLLYIDNPVGTGYSHSSSGPRITQEGYGQDLYECVEQFYKLFPAQLSNDLYVGGQSYAGKYVPVLAHLIHTALVENRTDIPLRGIYIGGPLFAPEIMFPANFEYIYNMGVISKYTRDTWRNATQAIVDEYLAGKINSRTAVNGILHMVFDTYAPYFDNYVFMKQMDYMTITDIMRSDRIRAAVHVGNLHYVAESKKVFEQLLPDIITSTIDKLAELLDADRYKVLIFSGDFDMIITVPMIDQGLMAMSWRRQVEYKHETRKMWYKPKPCNSDCPLYGYFSLTGPLCHVVVHGAGHMVPRDQLEISREMMLQFVQNGCINDSISHTPQK
ncbi:carboxypeptidase [Plakobranchus ocellatus]|uniref:Carboxypeptidase n=1 Tax=Plakobranchus ocellatus TaxID=259542 RepID=A0AAV4AJ08_9GAST|nr:carboxypeptidase [Plakobranchus ocellatus]